MDDALNIFRSSNNNCDNENGGGGSGSREPSVYVFGYGSLLWHPGFEYKKCITGCESMN